WRSAHRVQRHRARAVIDQVDGETGQLVAQVREDAAGVDRARRIARVEGDQRGEVPRRCREQLAHARVSLRLTSAHSVELMPNSLMKPSASATPQSAAWA